MTLAALYGLYAVEVDSTVVGGITRQNLATNSEINGEPTAGEVYRRHVSLYSQKVAPGFTTVDVAAGLGAAGALGVSIDGLGAGLKFYAQQHESSGTRKTGSTHRMFTFNAGILVPRQLRVPHRGDAELTYEAILTYDGSNDPVVITDSSAVPAAVDASYFTLGGATIGGVSCGGKSDLTVDFGLDAMGEGGDSDVWDTIASIRNARSSITFESLDPTLFSAANIPLEGKAATHANTIIYLRKRMQGGQFVADLTAEHIKLTGDGMVVPDDCFSADKNNPGRVSFTLPLRYDGTNAPLVVDPASAIS